MLYAAMPSKSLTIVSPSRSISGRRCHRRAFSQPKRNRATPPHYDHPVRLGVVESLNTTIKAVLRLARGMRDEVMLLLKLKWATARPHSIVERFLLSSLTFSCTQIGEDRFFDGALVT
jgi:hypothetical protein